MRLNRLMICCRRVGRGGNARFYIYQVDNHVLTYQVRKKGRTDGRTDSWKDGQCLLQSCVSAIKERKQLKREREENR